MTATSHESAPARRYRIERYLTEGGMGAIYVGKKLGPGGFEKEVVLKQLLPEYTARPEFRDLFFREAKISATLDHANIVHTFDLVQSEESLFIVMEYVRGVDLRTIIRRSKIKRRELAAAGALHIALEMLSGLAYAHARKTPSGSSMAIIHRDVSPSNVLCSAQGEVKLSDFGIAKAATHSSVFYRVRGKVGYMSPEQARNQPIDHRTDLYSVAVCLYEALTLERLFIGDLSTPADAIYSQPIVPPSKKRPGLPAALDVVLSTALSIDPDDRYQDAVAFAEALRQVAHRHGMLFSAPQLAEHLRFILGRDPLTWLSEERPAASGDPSTQKLPAKELEGKEASSIGLVIEGSTLYDGDSPKLVSASMPPGGNVKPDLRRSLGLPPEVPEEEEGTPTRTGAMGYPSDIRTPPPETARTDRQGFVSLADAEDAPTRIRDRGPTTPPPAVPARRGAKRRPTLPPPPPAHALAPPLPPESPFDDMPPTPAPAFGRAEIAAPTPPPVDPFSAGPPLPLPPPLAFGPPAGPPPGRPNGGLPRPSGSLYASPAGNLRHPPAPQPAPAPVGFESSQPFGMGGFAFDPPQTIDFGAASMVAPVRRSGPPGLLMLIVAIAAAVGGAKLGEMATRGDMAALEASGSAANGAAARERETTDTTPHK
jgi:serine/threonine protein kinase